MTREALLTLFGALVITNVDYCCSTLAGVYWCTIAVPLLNATARLVFSHNANVTRFLAVKQ